MVRLDSARGSFYLAVDRVTEGLDDALGRDLKSEACSDHVQKPFGSWYPPTYGAYSLGERASVSGNRYSLTGRDRKRRRRALLSNEGPVFI